MALRYPERHQATMFPPAIEDYVPPDAPVRFYDAFVDQIDLDEIGIERDPNKVGCPEYDPKVMLKLLVYAYSWASAVRERSSERYTTTCRSSG